MKRLETVAMVGVMGVALFGCKGSTKNTSETNVPVSGKQSTAPPTTTLAPTRLVLGDCATGTTGFVSGMKPGPVTNVFAHDSMLVAKHRQGLPKTLPRNGAQLGSSNGKAAAKSNDAQEDRLEEDELEEDDEPVSTGTPMRISSSKMGNKTSPRKTGQYAMRKVSTSKLASKLALKSARESGALNALKRQQGGAFARITGSGDASSGLEDANKYGTRLGNKVGTMQRGYGLGRARSRQHTSVVKFGQLQTAGDLDRSIIRRYLRRVRGKFALCYTHQLLKHPALKGVVRYNFTILGTGDVANVGAMGVSDKVSGCVAKVVSSIKFPKARNGGVVLVKSTLMFRAANPAKAAFKLPKPPAPYTAGLHNPLTSQATTIKACLISAPTNHGVFVVDMTADATGAITMAKTMGVGNAKAETCIANVARKATIAASKLRARHFRCSAAFGTATLDQTPHLDITSKAITFASKNLGAPKAIARESSRKHLPKLFNRLRHEASVRRAEARSFASIRLHHPIVVRPDAHTPYKVLSRVLRTIRATGLPLVLAAQDSNTWKLLREKLELPAVPIPAGSGIRWWQATQTAPTLDYVRDTPMRHISVLVADKSIWAVIGTRQRVLQSVQVVRTGNNHVAQLVTELKAWRKANPSVTSELHIAADDTVQYGDLVPVITALSNSGFPHWRLMEPANLSPRVVK